MTKATTSKVIAFVAGLVALAGLAVGPAQAANETATSDFSMVPQSGTLYKEATKPVDWRVEVEIKAPFPESPQILPLKEIRTDFPNEMSFNPDPKMKVCPDDQVGPDVNLSFPPDTIIARCPDSVLGNGRSELYLSRVNSAAGPNLKDAVLVAFNGGRTEDGLPRLKVYGYSEGVNTGIFMDGVLRSGNLRVAIPVLAFDSSVGNFDLNIPGRNSPIRNRRGLDKDYVRTTCAHSPWTGGASFTLGTRDTSGSPTSPDSIISAAPLTVPCKGAAGNAKFAKVRVRGPSKAKRGRKATFKVKFTNRGTATAKRLTVKASGKGASGKARSGKLAPGRSGTVKVKVKFQKKGKPKVRFKVGAKRARAGFAVKKIKVR